MSLSVITEDDHSCAASRLLITF